MAFLPSLVKVTKSPPSIQDFKFAETLHQLVPHRKWSKKGWANEFRLLRATLPIGFAEKNIESVLTWYGKNIGKEYVPVVLSAKSFRTKFAGMEAAVRRQERDSPDIEITKQAEEVALRLNRMNSWLLRSKEEMPVVVQVSLNNVRLFLDKINKYRTVLSKKPYSKRILEEGFLDKIQSNYAGGVESFVIHWMEKVNDRLLNWEGWSGKLLSWAFKEEHRTFQIMGKNWSEQYCGTAALWNQLMEKLNHGKA